MAKGSQLDPVVCTEEADFADAPFKAQSINVEVDASPDRDAAVEEPKRFSDATDGIIFSNDSTSPHHQHVNHDTPTHGPRQHVPKHLPSNQHSMIEVSGIPFLLVLVLAASLGFLYFKQRKQQKEWQLSSVNQLEKIRRRNLQSRESTPKTVVSKDEKLEDDVDSSQAKIESDAQNHKGEIRSFENTVSNNKTALPPTTNSNQSIGDKASKSKPSDHLSKIRATQQEQLERIAKSSQQQRKKRKQILHNSYNHHDADEAYQRRRSRILAEYEYVAQQQAQQEIQRERQQAQQGALNELEEMERMAILQQQNLEYQESLLRDQERGRHLTAENEGRSRREKAVEQAKKRLLTAGIRNNSGITLDDDRKGTVVDDDENRVKVKLLLPSGRKVEGMFASHHAMGSVYDLALLALDTDNNLLSPDDDRQDRAVEHDVAGSGHENIDSTNDDSCGSAGYDRHEEWKQIFRSFLLVSTFPPRTYDNLSLTLEECGLSCSAMLMVVVDSD